MTPSYVQKVVRLALDRLQQPQAPTVDSVNWIDKPFLRDALTMILNNESISDIKDNALALLHVSTYWEYLKDIASTLREILMKAN